MNINNLPSITKAVKIAEQIKLVKSGELDGFSISTRNLEPAPNKGYMVGMGDGEFNAAAMDNEAIIQALVNIIDKSKAGYVGAWRNGDDIVVEGATKFSRKFTAVIVGRQRSQIAIYDLANECDINL